MCRQQRGTVRCRNSELARAEIRPAVKKDFFHALHDAQADGVYALDGEAP
jgi:hypothetical protein